MITKQKTFDAVIESRKWKEAVARETEGMTREELMDYFNSEASQIRFRKRLEQARAHENSISAQHD